MCVHHLTSSKHLIELLNRMGHCVSYDEMRAVNTSIAEEVRAKVKAFRTVIPTNIKPGNNNLNEETQWQEYYGCYYDGDLSDENVWS